MLGKIEQKPSFQAAHRWEIVNSADKRTTGNTTENLVYQSLNSLLYLKI